MGCLNHAPLAKDQESMWKRGQKDHEGRKWWAARDAGSGCDSKETVLQTQQDGGRNELEIGKSTCKTCSSSSPPLGRGRGCKFSPMECHFTHIRWPTQNGLQVFCFFFSSVRLLLLFVLLLFYLLALILVFELFFLVGRWGGSERVGGGENMINILYEKLHKIAKAS